MSIECTCGRAWTHCRLCGSRNLYRKRFESNFQSKVAGVQVDVYLCKRCGNDSVSNVPCTAPPETKGSFVTKPIEVKVIPSINDPDFMEKANARLDELRRDGVSIDDCVTIMLKEGWPVDQPETHVAVQSPVEQAKPIEPEISLDEIISKMTGPKEKL